MGVSLERERFLFNATDWTVFSRASGWRKEQEDAERERLGIHDAPRARTREEIQEARVRMNDAFEGMERKLVEGFGGG